VSQTTSPSRDLIRKRRASTLVGIDDTDDRSGGCTSYVAYRLAQAAERDLIGCPRLVRLNPSVPWKTRGNGALALRFGRGRGRPRTIGRLQGRPVRAYPASRAAVDPEELLDRLWGVADSLAGGFQPGANPAIFTALRVPPPSLYWRAVRGVVPVAEYADFARAHGWCRTRGGRRGLVGAVAATAWRPRDRTYEAIAFRQERRWGTPRFVSEASVRAMDLAHPQTFNSYDWRRRRTVLTPHSPCPVLLGVRGETPNAVQRGLARLRSEPAQGWITFETNQATDDHVRPGGAPIPRTALSATGSVAQRPRSIRGGHVAFSLVGRHALDCLAYEPTKQFRAVVRGLVVGDRITVVGSIRGTPRGLNLEKLHILRLATVRRKVANPVCPCGTRMSSAGAGQGFRCGSCGRKSPSTTATFADLPRTIAPGWYEPPASARRHLSKPLKRMGLGDAWGPHATVARISMPIGST